MICSRIFSDMADERRARKSTPVLVAEDSQVERRKQIVSIYQPLAENYVINEERKIEA